MGYYTGDYYQGDYYAYRTGDPFLGGLGKLIGKVGKAVGRIGGKVLKVASHATGIGGAIGTVAGVLHGRGSKPRRDVVAAGSGLGAAAADIAQRLGVSVERFGQGGLVQPSGPVGMRGGGGGFGGRSRHMNFANGKAAHRAVRRLAGTHRLLVGIEKAARRAVPVAHPRKSCGHSRKCACK